MSEMTDLQVFMDRLEVSLHEKFMACDDASETPCKILLYVINSVADARNEVYGVTDNIPKIEELSEDDNSEVLYALQMATEHDDRHQGLALRTWLPRIKEWQLKAKFFDKLKKASEKVCIGWPINTTGIRPIQNVLDEFENHLKYK